MPAIALAAALVSTLHPYLIWHDIHVNREILDQLAGALLVLAMLAVPSGRRSGAAPSSASSPASPCSGTAASRCCRSSCGAYLIVLRRREALHPRRCDPRPALPSPSCPGWRATMRRSAAPRSPPTPGRSGRRTTRPRRDAAARRLDRPGSGTPGAPPSPRDAADRYAETGQIIDVDECAQMRYYRAKVLEFWRDAAGREGEARRPGGLDALAPEVGPTRAPAAGAALAGSLRSWVRARLDPRDRCVFAVVGDRTAAAAVSRLALRLLAYGTLMAMVFAGTMRYSVILGVPPLHCSPRRAVVAVRRPRSAGRPDEGRARTPGPRRRGSERHLLTLLPALRARGVDARFLGLDDGDPDPFYAQLDALGVPYDRLAGTTGSRPRASLADGPALAAAAARTSCTRISCTPTCTAGSPRSPPDRRSSAPSTTTIRSAAAHSGTRSGCSRGGRPGSSASPMRSPASTSARWACRRRSSSSSTTGSTSCPQPGGRPVTGLSRRARRCSSRSRGSSSRRGSMSRSRHWRGSGQRVRRQRS